ncbi:MAG TPA: hypothetical protein VJ861_13490, partial [Treponemataceae bacterium]|nr:hypothetical protein [Treponemataceae bacterium]
FNYPENMPVPLTLVSKKGQNLDCTYPGRTLVQTAIVFPSELNTRIFVEKLISSGFNTKGMNTPDNNILLNLSVDPWWDFGGEVEIEQGRMRIALGILSSLENMDAKSILPNTRIYFTFKIDALKKSLSF